MNCERCGRKLKFIHEIELCTECMDGSNPILILFDEGESIIDQNKLRITKTLEQLFENNSDCYTIADIGGEEISDIPALSKEKFVELGMRIMER